MKSAFLAVFLITAACGRSEEKLLIDDVMPEAQAGVDAGECNEWPCGLVNAAEMAEICNGGEACVVEVDEADQVEGFD